MTTDNTTNQGLGAMPPRNRATSQSAREGPGRGERVREKRTEGPPPLGALVDQYRPRPERQKAPSGPQIAPEDLADERTRERPERLATAEPQIIQDLVNIIKAEINQHLSLLALGPHQELLFRFNRIQGQTYQARFLESDTLLFPTLKRANQEGFIGKGNLSGEIVGFTTARGSTYELKDNATKRFKKVKNQQYGFSIRTVYLTKDVVYRLHTLIKSGGVPEMRDNELWVDFAKQRGRGEAYEDEKLASTDTPELGLYPFEIMPSTRGHRSWHRGHEIIDLDVVGTRDGYVGFQLTPKGRAELRRLEQQLVERLVAHSNLPALPVLASQLLEKDNEQVMH